MNANEPVHDPVVLLEELDAIIGEQQRLRERIQVLQAQYQALEPYADRFDRYPAPAGERSQFGEVNIESAVARLGYAIEDTAGSCWLASARESAACIREYPQQAQPVVREAVVESVDGPGSSGFRRSGDSARSRSGALVPVSSEFARARTRELADRPGVDRGRSR
ncbi:hypothetical protein [Nocardia vulneris]|nr:hypothetical protein [Nocardia vulneris]